LWPDKLLTPQKPKYSEGDQYTDYNGDTGTIGPVHHWNDHSAEWVYEVDLDDGGTDTMAESEFSSVSPLKKKQKPQKKKFKPGDRVKMIDESKSHQSLQGMEYTVDREEGPSADKKDTLYRIKDGNGKHWYATGAEMEHVGQKQSEPQQPEPQEKQQDQRQNVDPDQTSRQDFHPSQQDLMSHIKDTGTPYFPPTPEGQKAFEQYLIKQHNDFYEELKRTWGMLIKKYGKKGQLMVRKQKDALYAAAMEHQK
jgi:hypothetical protein